MTLVREQIIYYHSLYFTLVKWHQGESYSHNNASNCCYHNCYLRPVYNFPKGQTIQPFLEISYSDCDSVIFAMLLKSGASLDHL